jgi:hypothetical protein
MSNRNFSIHKFTIALGNICTYHDRGCPSIKYIFIQFFIFFLFSQLLVKEICFDFLQESCLFKVRYRQVSLYLGNLGYCST